MDHTFLPQDLQVQMENYMLKSRSPVHLTMNSFEVDIFNEKFVYLLFPGWLVGGKSEEELRLHQSSKDFSYSYAWKHESFVLCNTFYSNGTFTMRNDLEKPIKSYLENVNLPNWSFVMYFSEFKSYQCSYSIELHGSTMHSKKNNLAV